MPGGYLTGTVADLRSNRGPKYNLESYVKHMGFDRMEPIEYSPVEYGKDLGTDIDTTLGDAYNDDFTRLNQMGVQLAARGVDVLNPGNDPGAREAAKAWHAINTDVQRKAIAIKSSSELRKKISEEQAKGSYAPKFEVGPDGRPRALGPADMQNVVNYKGVLEEMAKAVDDINNFAKSYNTQTQADLYNQHINEARSGFNSSYKKRLLEIGLPESMVNEFVDDFSSRIGPASKDLSEKKLAESKRQFNAKEARIRSENEKIEEAPYAFFKDLQSVFSAGQKTGSFTEIMRQAGNKNYQGGDLPSGEVAPFLIGSKLPNDRFIKGAYVDQGKLNVITSDISGDDEQKMPLTSNILREVLGAKEYEKVDRTFRANNLIDKNNVISAFDADKLKFPGGVSRSSYEYESSSNPVLDLLPEGF